MPDKSKDPYELREKTAEEVCEWIAGWSDHRGLGKRLVGQHELERRRRRPDAIRSWMAIIISVVAIIASVLVAIFD